MISWDRVSSLISEEDWFAAFSYVLDRGMLSDVSELMRLTGPRPEVLSTSLLNRLYDTIAAMLLKSSNSEQCVIWVLAVTRSDRTREFSLDVVKKLVAGLISVASKVSKRGLLAALLASKLSRALR